MPENMYETIKNLFEENRDKDEAVRMAAYMRDLFCFYGIPTPKRRSLYRDLLKKCKKEQSVDWGFCDRCWSDPYREMQYAAIDYLCSMQGKLTYEDALRIKKYIQTKQWWDTVDGLDTIVGDIAFVDERINALMLAWSLEEDFWVRRAAIDHQLCRKEKTNKELLARIIINNFGSNEFFINKAIGWSLRDYSKTDPAWVRSFLDTYKSKMDKLSIREASKYI